MLKGNNKSNKNDWLYTLCQKCYVAIDTKTEIQK